MKLNDFMKEVHENAVAHGWWETDRSFAECIVLIHSEWSEALEEARAGRPMVWYKCSEGSGVLYDICNPSDVGDCLNYGKENQCEYRDTKPEGIAVELMDGAIRILDLCGRYSYRFKYGTVRQLEAGISREYPGFRKDMPLADALQHLHQITAIAGGGMIRTGDAKVGLGALELCAGVAIWWVRQQGLDPEKLLREKHEYNKTRPYKHGKKF